ncbi:MAG: trigger factor [Candidatus Dormibacteria bacterium]
MSPTSTDLTELEVSVERRPGSTAELSVTASAGETERALAQSLRHLGQRYRFPGFRPGKAPAAVVERAVGWEALRQHAIDDLLPAIWSRAVQQVGLEPVSPPQVSQVVLERDQPFQLVATVVLRPEVSLGDYRAIRVPLRPRAVADEEVAAALEELRRRYAQVSDASDREARRGDLVEADLTMRHRGEVVGTPDQRQSLDLEADELLPGMADQLIGARVGEQVEVTLTLPEEYGREELRGELVTITASVTQIQAKELPGLDDNLAAIAGHGDDLEGLRAYAREQLAAAAQAEAEGEQEREVLERLVAISQVEVPEAMVQAEIDRQLRELELRLAAAGISLEQWLQSQDKSREQFRGEQRQPAVEQVQRDLVLEQLARREQVEVEDQELDENLRRIFSRQASRESRQRAREPLRREMRLEKARRWLAELARGESPQG